MLSVTRMQHLLVGIAIGTYLCWREDLLPYASSLLPSSTQSEINEAEILAGTHDVYDGIQIDPDGLPNNPTEFAKRLSESLLVGQARQLEKQILQISYLFVRSCHPVSSNSPLTSAGLGKAAAQGYLAEAPNNHGRASA